MQISEILKIDVNSLTFNGKIDKIRVKGRNILEVGNKMLSYVVVIAKMFISFILMTATKPIPLISTTALLPFSIEAYSTCFAYSYIYFEIDTHPEYKTYLSMIIAFLVIVSILWGLLALLMTVGLFSARIKKYALALAYIVMFVELISTLFIQTTDVMIYSFLVNFCLLAMTIISFVRGIKR